MSYPQQTQPPSGQPTQVFTAQQQVPPAPPVPPGKIVFTPKLIVGFIMGIIGGIFMLVAPFIGWGGAGHGWYGWGSFNVPGIVSAYAEFAYLYLILVFGILCLIFSVLTPFLPAIAPRMKRTLFPMLVFIFSIITLVLAGVGMGHLASKGYGIEAGGPFAIVGAVLVLIAGILFEPFLKGKIVFQTQPVQPQVQQPPSPPQPSPPQPPPQSS